MPICKTLENFEKGRKQCKVCRSVYKKKCYKTVKTKLPVVVEEVPPVIVDEIHE